MKFFDELVYAIWYDTPNKYEPVKVSAKDRACASLHVIGLLVAIISFFVYGLTKTIPMPACLIVLVVCSILLSIPRFLVSTPPDAVIREDWLHNKREYPIKVKMLDTGETTNMLYNCTYNQGVVYNEDGMQIVDLPFNTYHKQWVAFDSDRE
ncbi:MAG: hypothetical protein IJZ68_06310 [Bacteroidaceae bacterium]|nr:hypothetical protein [Bacteroidaceae bacterium]